MLKALVIYPPDKKTSDLGDILHISRAVAQKKEGTHQNIAIRSILYDSFNQVFVVLYWLPDYVREGKVRV